MPVFGLGTWMLTIDEAKDVVNTALDVGYRHFDTAFYYKNENAIGSALKEVFAKGEIKREDVFIVTKLPPIGMRAKDVKHFLKLSLDNLQMDYVDLYLIHMCFGLQNVNDTDCFPTDSEGKHLMDMTTNLLEIWREMEEMVDLGWAKSIGVSNFSIGQIQRILDNCRIKPANTQFECHAYLQQNELVDFCHKNGITVCAYSPLGCPGVTTDLRKTSGPETEFPILLNEQLISEIATKYNKDPAQILLKFLLQRGLAVIPKSSNLKRIKSNINVFDFQLESSDMEKIRTLDKHIRMFSFRFLHNLEKHPECEGVID